MWKIKSEYRLEKKTEKLKAMLLWDYKNQSWLLCVNYKDGIGLRQIAKLEDYRQCDIEPVEMAADELIIQHVDMQVAFWKDMRESA